MTWKTQSEVKRIQDKDEYHKIWLFENSWAVSVNSLAETQQQALANENNSSILKT